jgi:hypothetical protein
MSRHPRDLAFFSTLTIFLSSDKRMVGQGLWESQSPYLVTVGQDFWVPMYAFFFFFFGCSKAPGENLSGRFARLPHRCGVLGGHHGRIRTPPTSSRVQECF